MRHVLRHLQLPGNCQRAPIPIRQTGNALKTRCKRRSLSHATDFPTKTVTTPEKSIDLNVEGSGESTQQVLSIMSEIKPIGEHVIKFEKDAYLFAQVTSEEELGDPAPKPIEATMKDLFFPSLVSGEENQSLNLKGNAPHCNKIMVNIPEAAVFDCNEKQNLILKAPPSPEKCQTVCSVTRRGVMQVSSVHLTSYCAQ